VSWSHVGWDRDSNGTWIEIVIDSPSDGGNKGRENKKQKISNNEANKKVSNMDKEIFNLGMRGLEYHKIKTKI